MTLQIQNIYYNHSQESRIYERGVYSIDSVTKRIHVHDGVTPNGIGTPITADLSQFATKSLSNVTQEDITNMLTNFGAVNMNSASPITTTQKDNLYGKLYLNGLKSDVTVPASNFLKIDPSTRQVSAQATSAIPTYFPCIDITQTTYARSAGVTYTAQRHCIVKTTYYGLQDSNGSYFYIDGVAVWSTSFAADRHMWMNTTQCFVVAAGSTYRATGGFTSLTEYGIKKLTF